MRPRSPLAVARLVAVALFTLVFAESAKAATVVASAGDATISRDQAAGTWALTAGGTTLTLTLDSARDFGISSLTTANGTVWTPAPGADSTVRVGGQTVALGNRSAGFQLVNVYVDAEEKRLQLNATFELASAGLRVTRRYAIATGSPTFETWTTYAPMSGTPTLSNLNALQVTVTAGTIRSLTGLQGDSANVQADSVFNLRQRTLGSGGHFEIGAKGRASESSIPWIAVDGGRDEFYAALMWSGAWLLTADRTSSGLVLKVDLPQMTTTLRDSVDGPHVLYGAVPGGLVEATAALRSYVLDGIRAGRPLTAPVIYNTWFAYGTHIDEASLKREMARVAELGVEMFVLDAGWYEGGDASDTYDFDSGLGSWRIDAAKFPNGLRPLRDEAHRLGMKFGLWVEPERVNLSVVGESGVEEAWLAKAGGDYGSDHAAQVCLSNEGARRWILGWLTALIDEVRPDYLKWDNNMWLNCDRDGHGHGATDGNFAHTNALYQVLSTLRHQYPDMLFENVSGGGNRLDLGMLRYSDVGWMDDRTAPSAHVRHNLEGLSTVFPPAYLLSFVTEHEDEPLHDSPDLSLYVRSRMTGILGFCFLSGELSEGDSTSLAREIAIYKAMRETLSTAAGSLLTAQAQTTDGPAWDVMQATAAGAQQALVCAYQTDMGVDRINVKPVALSPALTYVVTSVDTGQLGTASGGALMQDGIDILQSPNSAAHILIIKAKQ